jgi:hypothetical protein
MACWCRAKWSRRRHAPRRVCRWHLRGQLGSHRRCRLVPLGSRLSLVVGVIRGYVDYPWVYPLIRSHPRYPRPVSPASPPSLFRPNTAADPLRPALLHRRSAPPRSSPPHHHRRSASPCTFPPRHHCRSAPPRSSSPHHHRKFAMPPQLAAINRFSTTRLLTIRHWPVAPTCESTLSVIYLQRHPYFDSSVVRCAFTRLGVLLLDLVIPLPTDDARHGLPSKCMRFRRPYSPSPGSSPSPPPQLQISKDLVIIRSSLRALM